MIEYSLFYSQLIVRCTYGPLTYAVRTENCYRPNGLAEALWSLDPCSGFRCMHLLHFYVFNTPTLITSLWVPSKRKRRSFDLLSQQDSFANADFFVDSRSRDCWCCCGWRSLAKGLFPQRFYFSLGLLSKFGQFQTSLSP